MSTSTPSSSLPPPALLLAVSDLTRWRILQTLLGSEPLPVAELSRRLGLGASNTSKHCAVLREVGILQRGYGDLYKIVPHWITPDGRALDLGPVVLRLRAAAQ